MISQASAASTGTYAIACSQGGTARWLWSAHAAYAHGSVRDSTHCARLSRKGNIASGQSNYQGCAAVARRTRANSLARVARQASSRLTKMTKAAATKIARQRLRASHSGVRRSDASQADA